MRTPTYLFKIWDEAKPDWPYNCGTFGEATALQKKLYKALETDKARRIKYASWYIEQKGCNLIFHVHKDFHEDPTPDSPSSISIKVIALEGSER